MPNPALSDQLALQQLFQESMSPITNYSQGILNIAMADRARRQQAEYQARESAMVLDRQQKIQQAQAAHEERLVDLHSKARVSEQKAQFEMENTEGKKARRDEALAQARGLGITKDLLPDDADYQTIIEAAAKSRGRQLIAAAKTAGEAMKAYADYRAESAMEIGKRAMAQAIGMLTPDELKSAKIPQEDMNMIMADPTKMPALQIKMAKNAKASALLNRINADTSSFIATGMKDAERENPRLSGLEGQYKSAQANFLNLQTKGGYDEASGIESSQALILDRFQPKPAVPERRMPPLPPRSAGAAVVPNPKAGPSGPSAFENFWYNQPAPWSDALAPTSNVNAPPTVITSQPSVIPAPVAVAPFVPAGINPQPGIATDPSVLSSLRLRKFLQDSAATNNTLFPTAYPQSP